MIEVTFKINGGDSEESLHRDKAAIDGFFYGLLGTELKVVKAADVDTDDGDDDEHEEKPAPKKRTRRSKAQIAADKAKAEAAKKAEEDSVDGEPDEAYDSIISFEDLSNIVAKKVKVLKDAGKKPTAIAKKIKELGGTKLDTLGEDKYGELLEFVNTL